MPLELEDEHRMRQEEAMYKSCVEQAGSGVEAPLIPLLKADHNDFIWSASCEERAANSRLPCASDDTTVYGQDLAECPAEVWSIIEQNAGGERCGLRQLNWDNLVVAGGAVVAAVCKESDYPGDIDLFLHGLSVQAAREKVKEVVATLTSGHGENLVLETKNTVTVLRPWPLVPVQIVLKLYQSKAHCLTSFDLDCCSICYDGSEVWALARACRAFVTRHNLLDGNLQTFSTDRIQKYQSRCGKD
jgi:hypothetical protein